MISKKVISDIVSKYSLGNNIEKVKWIITDEKLIIHFINDSKNLVGYVDYRKEIGPEISRPIHANNAVFSGEA